MAASFTCSSITNPPLCYPLFSTFFLPFLLLTFSIYLLFYTILKRLKRVEEDDERQQQRKDDNDFQSQTSISSLKDTLSKIYDKTHQLNSTQLSKSILLEVLPSSSPKWGALFSPGSGGESGEEDESERIEKKKKKKKRRKGKKKEMQFEDERLDLTNNNKEELVCLYPFTSSSSATQRKIKQQYDELVKCHESKGLTLAQVGEFVNCLVDARNELQHKSECIKRKFTITKALLLKADRSSFDRLRQQINKLELDQKRLEEDAFVYNWLQHQLKLSPAYKKMIEIGACMELKAKAGELTESPDNEQTNISFEEFLAQEKKDAFWQKYLKPKSCSD